MPETILLIDYENVKDSGLDQLPPHDRAMLFVGRGQKPKLAFIQKRLDAGARLDLVQVSEQGRNNLDFYIAHYLGEEIAANPVASFIVFSNDTDLDPLLKHLTEQRRIDCRRMGPLSKAKLATRARTAAKATPPKSATRVKDKTAAAKTTAVKTAPLRAIAKPSPVIPDRDMNKITTKPVRPQGRTSGGQSVKGAVTGAARAASRNDNIRGVAIRDEDYAEAVRFLTQSKRQPKRQDALVNTLSSHLNIPHIDAKRIVDALVARGVIAITANRGVTYKV
jgi:hypothetical protein